MDMANPDSFLGSSLTNFKGAQDQSLKVMIDDNGNPQLSPNYAARQKARNQALDNAHTDAESAALPAIGM